MKRLQKIGLAAAAVIVPALSCGQRSLVLLDVKASTLFQDPAALLSVQLQVTANHDLTTHFPRVRLQTSAPYRIGMYLPSDMTGTVTFDGQVIDADGKCIIGIGSTVADGVQSGETTAPIDLIINPTSGCIPIGDGGPSGSGGIGGAGGMTGSAGAGGMTGAGGVTGSAGSPGNAG